MGETLPDGRPVLVGTTEITELPRPWDDDAANHRPRPS